MGDGMTLRAVAWGIAFVRLRCVARAATRVTREGVDLCARDFIARAWGAWMREWRARRDGGVDDDDDDVARPRRVPTPNARDARRGN